MNNMIPALKTGAVVALAVLLQYLLQYLGFLLASAAVFAALTLCLRRFGLRSAIAAAILIPWMTAVPQILPRVLTYPMFFANIAFVLILHHMTTGHAKVPFAALPAAALARICILQIMSRFVIGTWLEPHLQDFGAVSYGRMVKIFAMTAPWRQLLAALLGSGAVLAVPYLMDAYKTTTHRKRQQHE